MWHRIKLQILKFLFSISILKFFQTKIFINQEHKIIVFIQSHLSIRGRVGTKNQLKYHTESTRPQDRSPLWKCHWGRGAGLLMPFGSASSFQSKESAWEQLGYSPWRWPWACATWPSDGSSGSCREGRSNVLLGKTSSRLWPWPVGNSPGKTLGHATWVKFLDTYIF